MQFMLNSWYRHIHGGIMHICSSDSKLGTLTAQMPSQEDDGYVLSNIIINSDASTGDWTEISEDVFLAIMSGLNGPDHEDGPWSKGWEDRTNTMTGHKDRINYLEELVASYEAQIACYTNINHLTNTNQYNTIMEKSHE